MPSQILATVSVLMPKLHQSAQVHWDGIGCLCIGPRNVPSRSCAAIGGEYLLLIAPIANIQQADRCDGIAGVGTADVIPAVYELT